MYGVCLAAANEALDSGTSVCAYLDLIRLRWPTSLMFFELDMFKCYSGSSRNTIVKLVLTNIRYIRQFSFGMNSTNQHFF